MIINPALGDSPGPDGKVRKFIQCLLIHPGIALFEKFFDFDPVPSSAINSSPGQGFIWQWQTGRPGFRQSMPGLTVDWQITTSQDFPHPRRSSGWFSLLSHLNPLGKLLRTNIVIQPQLPQCRLCLIQFLLGQIYQLLILVF